MTDLKKSLQAAARKASEQSSVDMREETTTTQKLWPDGVYRGRVAEVIEYGIQAQRPYQGQEKAPAEEVQLRIMLFPNNVVKKALGDDVKPLLIRVWPLAVYNSPRSKSKQVFDLMNTTGDARNFREFIGEAFRFKLVTRTNSKGNKFQDIDLKGTLPAVDEETGKPLPVPEVPEDKLTLFTFNSPIKEMWDRLKIEGTRPDGTSKNFIQEKILAALNFKGSDVDRMLAGGDVVIPEAVADTSSEGFDSLPEPPTEDDDY